MISTSGASGAAGDVPGTSGEATSFAGSPISAGSDVISARSSGSTAMRRNRLINQSGVSASEMVVGEANSADDLHVRAVLGAPAVEHDVVELVAGDRERVIQAAVGRATGRQDMQRSVNTLAVVRGCRQPNPLVVNTAKTLSTGRIGGFSWRGPSSPETRRSPRPTAGCGRCAEKCQKGPRRPGW